MICPNPTTMAVREGQWGSRNRDGFSRRQTASQPALARAPLVEGEISDRISPRGGQKPRSPLSELKIEERSTRQTLSTYHDMIVGKELCTIHPWSCAEIRSHSRATRHQNDSLICPEPKQIYCYADQGSLLMVFSPRPTVGLQLAGATHNLLLVARCETACQSVQNQTEQEPASLMRQLS